VSRSAPPIGDPALLADASFVLEPNLHRLAGRGRWQGLVHQAGDVFQTPPAPQHLSSDGTAAVANASGSACIVAGGAFRSIVELQAAIKRFLAETNTNPRPFRWTKEPGKIIAAVKRGHQVLDSIH
jgi:hypothetical protein